jgi:hypothetical protein
MHKVFFMPHGGHLTAEANRIARKFGGSHVNIIDAGRPRGWFEVPSTGGLIDDRRIAKISEAIDCIGGIESLRRKRPLRAPE